MRTRLPCTGHFPAGESCEFVKIYNSVRNSPCITLKKWYTETTNGTEKGGAQHGTHKGTEVKSLRAGGVNLKDSWVDIENGELLVKGMHISPYDHGNLFNQDPMRVRRLLAHKSEIRRLHQQCKLQGYTLVPLSLYFKHGRVKMEVGLCKGKKLYDKRADAAQRDAKRSIDRAVKSNGKYY